MSATMNVGHNALPTVLPPRVARHPSFPRRRRRRRRIIEEELT